MNEKITYVVLVVDNGRDRAYADAFLADTNEEAIQTLIERRFEDADETLDWLGIEELPKTARQLAELMTEDSEEGPWYYVDIFQGKQAASLTDGEVA